MSNSIAAWLLFITSQLIFGHALNTNQRIVNGREAQTGEFPYQLSLRRGTAHICGASILDGNWAITAAHCIDGFEDRPQTFSLRMGSTMRLTGGRTMGLSSIYKHPSYNSETMNYDVALLRTPPNALRYATVAPIKLPPASQPIADDVPARVSGWGHMSSAESVLSTVLKYTVVYTVNQRVCQEHLKYQGGITDAMFCAAAYNTDACQGDSGGPISANDTLIGVVSWGVGCADPHYPGVYVRLAYPAIRSWIRLLSKL